MVFGVPLVELSSPAPPELGSNQARPAVPTNPATAATGRLRGPVMFGAASTLVRSAAASSTPASDPLDQPQADFGRSSIGMSLVGG